MKKFERVVDLHVRCSLKVRNFDAPGLTGSDTCGAQARYAVEMENGSKMWRCAEHKNLRKIEVGKTTVYVEMENA